jgi:hypothetical protein
MRDALTGLLALFLILAPGLASGGDMPPSVEEDGDDAEPVAPVEPGTQALDLGAANVDPALPCTVTMTDGKVHKGNLTHVFRATDWYGHDPAKNSVLNISVEPYLVDVDWKDVKSISVSRPNTSSDMDCYSDEDKDPILWECTLKQPSAVTLRAPHEHKGTYRVDTREPFTFVFDGDPENTVTFWLYKLVANTQSYEDMSDAIKSLQTNLKDRNRSVVRSIRFE